MVRAARARVVQGGSKRVSFEPSGLRQCAHALGFPGSRFIGPRCTSAATSVQSPGQPAACSDFPSAAERASVNWPVPRILFGKATRPGKCSAGAASGPNRAAPPRHRASAINTSSRPDHGPAEAWPGPGFEQRCMAALGKEIESDRPLHKLGSRRRRTSLPLSSSKQAAPGRTVFPLIMVTLPRPNLFNCARPARPQVRSRPQSPTHLSWWSGVRTSTSMAAD